MKIRISFEESDFLHTTVVTTELGEEIYGEVADVAKALLRSAMLAHWGYDHPEVWETVEKAQSAVAPWPYITPPVDNGAW